MGDADERSRRAWRQVVEKRLPASRTDLRWSQQLDIMIRALMLAWNNLLDHQLSQGRLSVVCFECA
jgi:hypothetical protein